MKIIVKLDSQYILDWLKDQGILVPRKLQKCFREVINNSIYLEENK